MSSPMMWDVGGGTSRRGMGKPGGQTTITEPVILKGHRCMCVCVEEVQVTRRPWTWCTQVRSEPGWVYSRLGLLSGTNHLAPLYVRLCVRLSIIHTYISFLILINTLRSRYYQPHFKSEETEVKFMRAVSNRARFKLGSLGLQSACVSKVRPL